MCGIQAGVGVAGVMIQVLQTANMIVSRALLARKLIVKIQVAMVQKGDS